MRIRIALLLTLLLGLLAAPVHAEIALKTAWLGEHEAFVAWYAKKMGWDKEAGLSLTMLRFGSGDKIMSTQQEHDWAIAACGAVPVVVSPQIDNVYIIGLANTETEANAIYAREGGPIMQAKGANPQFPDVFGSAESLRGKTILCPVNTSAHYLLDRWLTILGLTEKDVKVSNVLPGPAIDMMSKDFGDAAALWWPANARAAKAGLVEAASSKACGVEHPIVLVVKRDFAHQHPDQVIMFLRLYLRTVAEMQRLGPDTLVEQYRIFALQWYKQDMSREDILEDLRLHPIYNIDQQMALFDDKEKGLPAWISQIADFYARSGSLSPERRAELGRLSFLNPHFLKAVWLTR